MESPLQIWLTLQCQAVAGAEAALAVIEGSEPAPGAAVAHWPSPEGAPRRLSALVEAARARGRVVVQEPGAPGAASGVVVTHVALPVLREGFVIGAVALSVRGVPHPEIKAVVERLARGVHGLESLIEVQHERDRLDDLLSLAGGLLEHAELPQASHALAGELARRLGCERVALGLLRKGRMRVVALSSGLRVAEERGAVRVLASAMEEAVDQDAAIELPHPPDGEPHATRAHEDLAQSGGAGTVCTIPLGARGGAVGALTCEWSRPGVLGASLRDQLLATARFVGPLLELFDRAEASPLERARTELTRWVDRHLGADRSLARGLAGALAALLLLLAVVPGQYRVAAPARLEGRVERALVASVPGYIAEAHARAGDVVRAGDVLARLDDRDLRLERRRWSSQKAQLEREYREALAGGDRTQVSILGARIAQASARLALVDEQLGRTSLVAPFDGVVLEGDLERSLGSPVERGDVLFELAPLDGYRIIVEVDERDIADVGVGQRGRLALSALPDRSLSLTVERITPISTARDGRNYFRVEAALEEPAQALRPGMEGIAKIDVDQRRLLWIWTHQTLDWLRLRLWRLLP